MLHSISPTQNQGRSKLCVSYAAYHWAKPIFGADCPPLSAFIALHRKLDTTDADDRMPYALAATMLAHFGLIQPGWLSGAILPSALSAALNRYPVILALPYYSAFGFSIFRKGLVHPDFCTVPPTTHAFHCYGQKSGEIYLQDSYGTALWYDGTFRLSSLAILRLSLDGHLRGLILEPTN